MLAEPRRGAAWTGLFVAIGDRLTCQHHGRAIFLAAKRREEAARLRLWVVGHCAVPVDGPPRDIRSIQHLGPVSERRLP